MDFVKLALEHIGELKFVGSIPTTARGSASLIRGRKPEEPWVQKEYRP